MSKQIKIEKNNRNGGFCADFYIGNKKYWADIANTFSNGRECMIFEYNEDGEINYSEVYVNRNVSVNEEDLLKCINEFIASEKKQITIEKLIPFLNEGWVACGKEGDWCWYPSKPKRNSFDWNIVWDDGIVDNYGATYLSNLFNIAPAEDWTKSLIRIKGE